MIFSDRAVGFGMVAMGCLVLFQGLAHLFSGQLLFTGQGKHPWLKGFFIAVFGDYAVAASVLFYFLLGASFIFMGCNLIRRHGRDRV